MNLLQEVISFFEHLQPSLEKNLCQKNPILAEIALQVRDTGLFEGAFRHVKVPYCTTLLEKNLRQKNPILAEIALQVGKARPGGLV